MVQSNQLNMLFSAVSPVFSQAAAADEWLPLHFAAQGGHTGVVEADVW